MVSSKLVLGGMRQVPKSRTPAPKLVALSHLNAEVRKAMAFRASQQQRSNRPFREQAGFTLWQGQGAMWQAHPSEPLVEESLVHVPGVLLLMAGTSCICRCARRPSLSLYLSALT